MEGFLEREKKFFLPRRTPAGTSTTARGHACVEGFLERDKAVLPIPSHTRRNFNSIQGARMHGRVS